MNLDLRNSLGLGVNIRLIKTRQWLDLLWLPLDLLRDCIAFICHCRLSPTRPRAQRDDYDLIFFAHTIEKGLSLPQPRPEFGRNNVCRIVYLLERQETSRSDALAVRMALGSLKAYLQFHAELDIKSEFLAALATSVENLEKKLVAGGAGGLKPVNRVYPALSRKELSYGEFLESRFSCRAFTPEPISKSLLHKILEVARSAPSQCNRQSARIHIFQDPKMIAKLLDLQGGARGFAESVSTLMVISNDLCSWVSRGERNQGYVDSGLFAMAVLYSCHAHGVASCPLNFAKTFAAEKKFRKTAGLPANERILMLIAAGYLDESRPVCARSARAEVEAISTTHP